MDVRVEAETNTRSGSWWGGKYTKINNKQGMKYDFCKNFSCLQITKRKSDLKESGNCLKDSVFGVGCVPCHFKEYRGVCV